jgi:hypothetical protein
MKQLNFLLFAGMAILLAACQPQIERIARPAITIPVTESTAPVLRAPGQILPLSEQEARELALKYGFEVTDTFGCTQKHRIDICPATWVKLVPTWRRDKDGNRATRMVQDLRSPIQVFYERKTGAIMEEYSIIVKALAAGAVASFRPDNLIEKEERLMDNNYVALKRMLREKYPQVDADILDIGPGSEARLKLLQDQLANSGALDDSKLQEKAQSLIDEILKHEPEAAMAVGLIKPGDPYL